jgi:hypothetical protein
MKQERKQQRMHPNAEERDVLCKWFRGARLLYNKSVALYRDKGDVTLPSLRELEIVPPPSAKKTLEELEAWLLAKGVPAEERYLTSVPARIQDNAIRDFRNALASVEAWKPAKHGSKSRPMEFQDRTVEGGQQSILLSHRECWGRQGVLAWLWQPTPMSNCNTIDAELGSTSSNV